MNQSRVSPKKWVEYNPGQTHGANAVMVVGVIRVMSPPKVKKKNGANIFFTFPSRPWRAPPVVALNIDPILTIG